MKAWQRMKLPPASQEVIALGGGMDQVTPTLQLPPGVVRRGANFECSINGGYTRIAGYDVFDGRTNPDEAVFLVFTCVLTAPVLAGDTVTGVTSSATGLVIYIDDTTVVVTKTVGTFIDTGESLTVLGSPVGAMSSYDSLVADTDSQITYTLLAEAEYRGDITAVPGSGPIRGIAKLGSTIYAWRNNAGGTAMAIYKSTTSGWTLVSLGYQLTFSAGSTEILEGQTVTGATTGTTGVVARVVLESGAWTGTAAGRLILSSTAGAGFGTENLNVGGGLRASTTGGASAITLAPSGRVYSTIANFGGDATRIYGADGVNKGFEFDGTVYVPITTGMADDTPDRARVLKNHLFFSFGSSLQFSGIDAPYVWDVVVGAGEIAMNDNITELRVLPGDQTNGAMAVYTDTEVNVLYGYSAATFTLARFSESGGAISYSGADLEQPYVFGDFGVTRLRVAQDFGNFLSSSLTMKLLPFTRVRRDLVTAAVANREKGQYRIFFSDGYALYITIVNGKMVGAMPMQYDHDVTCVCNGGFASSGEELTYFGSSDGFVYREGKSTSFAGEPLAASLYLVFNSSRSARVLKEYMKAVLEITGSGIVDFSFGYTLGYNSADKEQPTDLSDSADLRSGFWDEFVWDNFVWDTREAAPLEFRIEGSAENIAMCITSYGAGLEPFTINTAILSYKIRRRMY